MRQQRPMPTPEPTTLRHNPTADEFEHWCQHPVTQWVAKAYAAGLDANVNAWTSLLTKPMNAEDLDRIRIELRVRSDSYAAFLQATHANYLKINDEKEWKKQYG